MRGEGGGSDQRGAKILILIFLHIEHLVAGGYRISPNPEIPGLIGENLKNHLENLK